MTPPERTSFDSEQAREALLALLRVLEGAGIRHYFSGALVRNLLGAARTTEDFDVVVDTHAHSAKTIESVIVGAGYPLEGPLKGDLGTRFVTEAGGFETDIWLPPDTETSRHEMENRKVVDWRGTRVFIMDPEDYVLRKLVTWRRIRRKTTDLDDAYQVLLIAWDSIDRARLLERAAGHRIGDVVREVLDVAAEDRRAAGLSAD